MAVAKAHFPLRKSHRIEATMIQGSNVNIGYAKLNMTNNQINEEREKALDLLRSNCSLAALSDSNERYDPPRCADTTRRNIIQKMEDWVRHDGRHVSSIFWLHGGAGAGKSALAQTLAEKFKANDDLAASFFFFKADVNRNNGNRLIPTLAYQVVQSFQGLSPIMEEKILQNPDVFRKSRQTQMLELLIEPLIRLSLEETDGAQSNTSLKSHPRLIVIDGLDECSDPDIQHDLLRLIGCTIPHLPYPLRFLITSRPESHITRVFQHDLRKVARYNLSDDVQILLKSAFSEICRTHPLRRHLPTKWPPRSAISSIVERSSGHFIYASTVIRFIQSPRHRPDDRLQVILGLRQPHEQDQPFARLDALYGLIFLEIQDPGQLERIHCALGIMHLRSLKRGLFCLSNQWASDHIAIDLLLDLRPGDLALLFDGLLSLVTFDNDDIRIFHKSLFDYLLDSSRSRDLELDLGLAHETAANYLLKGKTSWEFQNFAYHCQFARLNDALKDHLLSLACNPSKWSPLQSILYFLQAICRPEFDSKGDCHRTYVEKKNRCLRPAVPLGQRLKCLVSGMTMVRKSVDFERELRLSFNGFSVLNVPQRKGTNKFNGRVPIPAANTSVVKAIKLEHEMFSSYVKACHRYPKIVVSFLEPSNQLIHSCHAVLRQTVSVEVWVVFMMLMTYTEYGVRLSCSEFEGFISLRNRSFRENIMDLVAEHRKTTQNEVNNNVTMVIQIRLHESGRGLGVREWTNPPNFST